jgi:hypothetical protein
MVVSATLLMDELKSLRKGRGVQAPGVDRQVGPALREVCGIADFDGAEVVREKLQEWVLSTTATLPTDLRLAVTIPLALHGEAQHAFLSDRVAWLAQREQRDARTIRRRIDLGLTRLVEAAVRPTGTTFGSSADGWHVRKFEALLRVDAATPVCLERHLIVAERDDVEQVEVPVSAPGAPDDLEVEVQLGAVLVERTRTPDGRLMLSLQLPRALRAGETHEYGLQLRLPSSAREHYVFRPERRCDLFDLRVRFDPAHRPEVVRRVSGAVLQEEVSGAEEPLAVDRVGEVGASFREPHPGLAYGLRWTA